MVYKLVFIPALWLAVSSFSIPERELGKDHIGYFWQVSDFHYDANYSIHGNPSKMCHDNSGSSSANGIYGNYNCDAPWLLVMSAVEGMKKLHPNPDFILWTGDSVPHVADSDLNAMKVFENIGNVTSALYQTFPNTTIYPVLGNHDPYPENQMPYLSIGGGNQYYGNILQLSHWDTLLGEEEQKLFSSGGGYYSVVTNSNLRILGLNTNLYYSQNKLVNKVADPAQQFDWLEKQLSQARKNNQSVYIVAHVPPGGFERDTSLTWFYEEHNRRYLNIMLKHSDIIAAQIYGHEHTDSFRILFDSNKKPVGQLFLSPAVTPWKSTLPGVGANNPAIRLYKYNQKNGQILDIYQYYLNLTEANSIQKAAWHKEYQATKDYSIDHLSPGILKSLVDSFHAEKNDMFNRYLIYNTVGYDTNPVCNHTCVRGHICAITELYFDAYSDCLSGRTTTVTPSSTTRHPKHHKPPPKYMYYIIGGMAIFIVILFVVIAFVCVTKRKHVAPPRYVRFPTKVAHGPIN